MTDKNRKEILKKAKPIRFYTEMVRAILGGRKTQTRQVVLPNKDLREFKSDKYHNGWWLKGRVYDNWGDLMYDLQREKSCKYHIGDILYVRETWAKMDCNKCSEDSYDCESAVERDGLTVFCDGEMYVYKATDLLPDGLKWKPSIHMPKEAARIFLRVTDVRVERLQDIDGYSVLAEGIDNGKSNPTMGARWENMQLMAFSKPWNSTIKKSDLDKYGWDADPWVWVIEFERVE